MQEVLQAFVGDPKVQALAILVALDIIFGVTAALKTKTFSWERLADFLKDDVLFKLIPYYALWAATYVGGDLVIPGIDVGAIAAAGFAFATASMVASLYGSFKEIGFLGKDEQPAP